MFTIKRDHKDPIVVTVTVQEKELNIEIDTGAAVSLIREKTFRQTWQKGNTPPLEPTNMKLSEEVSVLGTINVNVKYEKENKRLSLIVVKGDGPSLLGRDWLMLLKLNWKAIYLTVRKKLEDHLISDLRQRQ